MYKKKSYAAYIITILAALIIGIGLFVFMSVMNKRSHTPETEMVTESESEISKHEILIHKTNAGTLDFEQRWLKSDSDTKTILEVEDFTLVSMHVKPMGGKYLENVNMYDAKSVNTEISHVVTKLDGGDYNIDFTMPETDIVMTFQFSNTESDQPFETEATETETETEGNPYGLKLHGVTADVISSFNGQFDDRDFLQQIGSALHVDSARSAYHNVTDVTFSTEAYTETKESDKVYYYIYFNNDPNWKVLSTYYLKEHTYVFTEPAVKETEVQTEAQSEMPAANNSYSGNSNPGTPAPAGQSTTVVASLDVMSVSSNFLNFTGGDDSRFYDEIFNYVVEKKGQTGAMTGTMSEYTIDPETQTATFSVTLNTGKTIKGTYKKQKNSYSFSGL